MTQKRSSEEEIAEKRKIAIQEDSAPESAKISPTVAQSPSPMRLESLSLVSAVLTASSKESVSDNWIDFTAANNIPSFPSALIDNNGLEKHEERPAPTVTPAVILNNLLLLAAATYALTSGLLWMLYQFEWFQSWRYLWPLLGAVYAIDSSKVLFDLVGNDKNGSQSILPRCRPSLSAGQGNSVLATTGAFAITALTGIAGIGLVIGGAYDAFMPVWMTGPNVFTAAGIGQDSAMILLGLASMSAVQIASCQPTNTSINAMRFWGYVLLLSQLYILSDSAVDDVLSGLFSTLDLT